MPIEAIRRRIKTRTRHTWRSKGQAAVLVPLIEGEDGIELLLTRRTDTLRTHAGHVAFPGGRVDPGDDGVIDAALREAEEEVGLPRDRVEILGLLDDLPTVTGETSVTPVVGRIVDLPPLVADPTEVARIFRIPLPALREADGWSMKNHVGKRGKTWPVYYFPWDGETLWGLSAYITLQLLWLTPNGGPYQLPPPYDR